MSYDQADTSAVFYRSPRDEYPVFVRAEGYTLWDDAGTELIDLTSAISGAALIGQGSDVVARAMSEQVKRLSYVHTTGATTPAQEELATRLVALAPKGINKVMFSSGGSEANEIALRITRQYHLARGEPQRWKVVSLHPSYHGATLGALSMTGRWDINSDYDPYLFNARKVFAPVTFRGPYRDLQPDEVATRAADALKAVIEGEGPETVAAFIAEPIALSTGMAVPPAGYWALVREICDRYGVVFIADEVLTGMGRTGRFLALEYAGVTADITTLAKGLGGGYVPLGATLIRGTIAEAIGAENRHMAEVHTYSGSAQSCAVGLAILDIIEAGDLIGAATRKGERLRSSLREHVSTLPWVGEVRGLGLFHGIEYVADRETARQFPPSASIVRSMNDAMWKRGFLTRTMHHNSSLVGDVTTMAPALTVHPDDLERGVLAMSEAIRELGPSWEMAR